MSVSGGQTAAGILLVIAGAWIVLQTIVGGLAGRLLALGGSSSSSGSSAGSVLPGASPSLLANGAAALGAGGVLQGVGQVASSLGGQTAPGVNPSTLTGAAKTLGAGGLLQDLGSLVGG